MPSRVVAYAVEHHDGVVERVPEDGQDGDHRVRRDLEVEDGVDADGHQDVVDHGDEGGQGHLRLEADADVDRHHDEEDDQRLDRLVGDGRAPRRSDGGDADLVGLRLGSRLLGRGRRRVRRGRGGTAAAPAFAVVDAVARCGSWWTAASGRRPVNRAALLHVAHRFLLGLR